MEGLRNSVGFLRTPDLRDSIHPQTLSASPRRVDKDRYLNAGLEARFLTDYAIGDARHTLSTGVRGFIGDTWRGQNGRGTTGSAFDLDVSGLFPVSLDFRTINAAFFAENIFRIGRDFLIVPGLRWENLSNRVGGRMGVIGGQSVSALTETRTRSLLLSGVGLEYHVAATELYANASQAYRPVLFAELTGNATTDVIDPALRDARGWNADIGWRGRVKDWLFFDMSLFHMAYRGRVGVLAQQRTDGSIYNLRTNVGDSRSRGVELLVEWSPFKLLKTNSLKGNLTLFLSTALVDARYREMRIVSRTQAGLEVKSLQGRRVENAPDAIHRAGVTYMRGRFSATLQYSYTGMSYSDAGNTAQPISTGVTGPIPAYDVFDLSGSFRCNELVSLRAGINNLLNERYFTRRAGGYPGPGILPAEPINGFVTVGVRL
jgi:Fe(3+) dicitrate transport protein